MLIFRQSALASLLMGIILSVNANATTSLKHIPTPHMSLLKHAKLIGPMAPDQKITFTVWLKLRNQKKLEHLVNEVYSPQSPNYQHFLTKEQFDFDYAPNIEALEKIRNYFTAYNMQTQIINQHIRVTATVKQIKQTLHTSINYYYYNNKRVYSNSSIARIKAELSPYISAITGLSSLSNMRTLSYIAKKDPLRKKYHEPIQFIWENFIPLANPTTTSIGGFTGQQLRKTYNVDQVPPINNIPIDGSGQTVVIMMACGTNSPATILNDANQYNTANGLKLFDSNNFAIVNPDGTPYTGASCPLTATGVDSEIALDIESAHTIAPGANIILVLTTSLDQIAESLAITIMTILNNNYSIGGFPNAFIISNSWGGAGSEGDPVLDPALQLAAASGLSLNFGSGDCGDQTYHSFLCSAVATTPTVFYPASSSYASAIGGSSLFVDNNWSYAFESGWGTYANGQFQAGSGGGISQVFSAPFWQNSIRGFSAGGYPGIVGNYGNRALPDIAMLGDAATGLLIYFTTTECTTSCLSGGTSLATPLFSGTLALINQARTLSFGIPKPIGLVSSYLYNHNEILINAKALNVITPPHRIISGATPVPGGPISAFTINGLTFNWDSSLTIVEDQFWNDVVGVGSPNIPSFVQTMASF